MSVIDKILGRAKATSAEAIRNEELKAQAALDQARANAIAAGHEYRRTLLDERPELTSKARAALTECEVAVDRAEALVNALRERFLAACEAEAAVERNEQYEAAVAAAKAARAALLKCPGLAKSIAAIIRTVAEADAVIMAANRNLPDDKDPIDHVEQTVRGLPAEKEIIVKQVIGEPKWHYADWQNSPIAPQFVEFIESDDGVNGVVRIDDGFGHPDIQGAKVVKRRTVTEEFKAARGAYMPMPLSANLCLPGLTPGQPDFFQATGEGSFDLDPQRLLRQLDRLSSEPTHFIRGEREVERRTRVIGSE